jgi:hypothetical protein
MAATLLNVMASRRILFFIAKSPSGCFPVPRSFLLAAFVP